MYKNNRYLVIWKSLNIPPPLCFFLLWKKIFPFLDCIVLGCPWNSEYLLHPWPLTENTFRYLFLYKGVTLHQTSRRVSLLEMLIGRALHWMILKWPSYSSPLGKYSEKSGCSPHLLEERKGCLELQSWWPTRATTIFWAVMHCVSSLAWSLL